MIELDVIHNMNCLDGVKLLDDNSIDCCITSPPYWGLRSYLPDVVVLKNNLTETEKEDVIKELTLLGISGTMR